VDKINARIKSKACLIAIRNYSKIIKAKAKVIQKLVLKLNKRVIFNYWQTATFKNNLNSNIMELIKDQDKKEEPETDAGLIFQEMMAKTIYFDLSKPFNRWKRAAQLNTFILGQ
jgi:hypothetical protein